VTLSKQSTWIQKTTWVKGIGKFLISPSSYLLPRYIISRADSERAIVDQFILSIRNAQPGELLLDAGAGNFRFREVLIEKKYNYESQDFEQVFDQNSRGKHTYVCDINSIPAESNRFGVVVCTQVLEHLPDPLGALKELARILKPGGELFLTTNLLFPIHGAPYDFFRFTNFGLEHLCVESGFSNIEVVARGGFFRLCGKIIFDFPAIASSWLFFDGSSPHGQRELKIRSWPLVVLFTPVVFLLDIVSTCLAFLVSNLDWIDRKRRFTLGYQLRSTVI
jgi:SAM-dependent methyltransferase